jgi:DNA-binding transcriptional LysR family regulator
MMDLNDWLIFAQVVEAGGLSAASRLLDVPKSTLSRRLTKLEDDFGSRLVIRRGRTFELTEAGRLFYQEARRLTEQVANSTERLSEGIQQEGGTLRMTAPKAPGGYFLGVWLAEFIQQYPHIHIELDLTDRTVNLYEQGYDLALRVGPMIDSSLIARKLGESERILVAAPEYLKLYGYPESPEELSQHKCISFGEHRSGQSSWVLSKNRQSQRINFHSALRCDDMATNMRLVQSGAGITMIPAFVCKESLASGSLQHILTQWYGPTPEFYLVYTERELMPNRLRLLIEFLTERSRAEKWRLSMRHVQPKALL